MIMIPRIRLSRLICDAASESRDLIRMRRINNGRHVPSIGRTCREGLQMGRGWNPEDLFLGAGEGTHGEEPGCFWSHGSAACSGLGELTALSRFQWGEGREGA